MPDRYSDADSWPVVPPPQVAPDEHWAAQRRRDAVLGCDLCDDDGYRGGLVCDHIDHTEAAVRGMTAIRRQMGWDGPKVAQRYAQPQQSLSDASDGGAQ